MLLITLLNTLLLTFAADGTWYCKKGSKFYEIKTAYQCTSKASGPAFYKSAGNKKPGKVKGAKFFISDKKLKVSYPNSSGTTQTIEVGNLQHKVEKPVKVEKPKKQKLKKSSGNSWSTGRNGSGNNTGGRDQIAVGGRDSETTNGGGFNLFGRKNNTRSSGLNNKYPPRSAGFTANRTQARNWANADWNKLNLVDRGKHLYSVAEALIQAHGYTSYKPAHIVCKAYNESTFDPQIKASSSTASGLSQVTYTTVRDMTDRPNRGWPQSLVPGFEHIRDGEVYRQQMAASIPAQLEAGMFVLELKKMDFGGSTPYDLLYNYYGKNPSPNKDYATKITNCANCIGNGNITQCCLSKAKGLCKRK